MKVKDLNEVEGEREQAGEWDEKEGRDLTERGRERRTRGQFLEGKEEQAP